MNGLYNALFGEHAHATELLRLLGTTDSEIPRYRSCYWNGEYIVIHTRTGGGNRDAYENEARCRANYPEYFEGDNPRTGPYNDDLRKLPGYQYDQDDDFDSTYADFFYKPPEAALEALKSIPADTPPAEQWQQLFAALANK